MMFPSPLDDYSSEALLRAVEQQIRRRQPLSPLEHIDLIKEALSLLQALELPRVAPPLVDMTQLCGNYHAHRALEVAASGNHAILLVGGIGAGKATMLHCLPTLLPGREKNEQFSLAVLTPHQERALDYGAFVASLRLACGGILHLEHLSRFHLWQLEAMRRAQQEHLVNLPESHEDLRLSEPFLLAATVEPCPCGNYGDPEKECTCSADAISEHQLRLQETVHSCFDIQVEVKRPESEQLLDKRGGGEPSERVAVRVGAARDQQARRYADRSDLRTNADLVTMEDVEHYILLDSSASPLTYPLPPLLATLLLPMRCWGSSGIVKVKRKKEADGSSVGDHTVTIGASYPLCSPGEQDRSELHSSPASGCTLQVMR